MRTPGMRAWSAISVMAFLGGWGRDSIFSRAIPRRIASEPPPKFDDERIREAEARRQKRAEKRAANDAKSKALNPCRPTTKTL